MEAIRWKTYDGREIYIHEMTHEHISSLHHFLQYISIRKLDQNVMDEIKRVIETNYGGIILPYRPPSDVIGEAEKLHEKGLLKYNKSEHKFDIIDNGDWVGEIILKPEQEINEETGMFKEDRLAIYKERREKELLKMLIQINEQFEK